MLEGPPDRGTIYRCLARELRDFAEERDEVDVVFFDDVLACAPRGPRNTRAGSSAIADRLNFRAARRAPSLPP